MLARHPLTGNQIRILQTDASIWKERKTLVWNATEQESLCYDTVRYGGKLNATYNGCVISNQTDIALNYQTKETIVGIDFDGKYIKVEGESGRLISTPIIESIDVSSENSGILRQANVNVR